MQVGRRCPKCVQSYGLPHPYGLERWTAGEAPTDFGFTSQRNEKSFGLMDYNARYYSPVLGRFVSPDTIVPEPGSSGGFNRYRYVRNNPVKYTDPSGHCAVAIIDTIACAVVAVGLAVAITAEIHHTVALVKTIEEDVQTVLPQSDPVQAPTTTSGYGDRELHYNDPKQLPGTSLDVPEMPREFPGGSLVTDPPNTILEFPLDSGIELPITMSAKIHKHHIFPQQFRDWFSDRGGINIDDYTVAIDSRTHLRGVHGRGLGDLPGRWNQRWAQFIIDNPEADPTQIGQFGSELMREFGLDNLPIEPY